MLVVTTSSNQVYVLDVEDKKMGDWSRFHSQALPRRFQEFPGEVIGLSFPPSNSSSVIVYSARYSPLSVQCVVPSDTSYYLKLKWELLGLFRAFGCCFHAHTIGTWTVAQYI